MMQLLTTRPHLVYNSAGPTIILASVTALLMYMTCLKSQTIHTYPVLKFGNHANLGKVKKESTMNDVIEGKGGLISKDHFNLVPHSCKK